MAYSVTVDVAKCEGCEECVGNCPVGVFQMKDGKADPYQADLCEGCETCVSVCPSGSITLTES
ncbi:MAG: 4Fe-4S dicluster domain-containing protein [Thermodesulfovibrionales bacterium]